MIKKKQVRTKKCYFRRSSSHALEIARQRKKEMYGEGKSWQERYKERKKALEEWKKWWK